MVYVRCILSFLLFFQLISFDVSLVWGRYHKKNIHPWVELFSNYPNRQIDILVENSVASISFQDGTKKKVFLMGPKIITLLVKPSGIQLEPESKPVSQILFSFSKANPAKIFPEVGPKIDSIDGKIKISIQKQHFLILREMDLETYVANVLAGELPSTAPLEALKAQAVVIRTYALDQMGRHSKQGFDFCSLTHCQAMGMANNEIYQLAVTQTKGLILTYQGEVIPALFHSTCGGHTSANQHVFGGRALPFLQGVDDEPYCQASPHYQWLLSIEGEELIGALNLWQISSLQDLKISPVLREPQGRWFQLEVFGDRVLKLSAQDFLQRIGKNLGWNRLKSTWFEVVSKQGDLIFKGRGLGHGVGLCQWGAIGRAKGGWSFDTILKYYFPHTHIQRMVNL